MEAQRNWYLILSKPHQEHKAQQHLQQQHFETYLPLSRQHRVRRARRVEVTEPLFPGYLFIRLDTSTDNWAPIRSTPGVSHMVRFGSVPAQVPDACIQGLRAHENPQGIHDLGGDLQRGDKVKVLDGPFRDLEAVFLEPRGNKRVMILLHVLGGLKPVEVARSQVAPTE